MKLNEHSPSTRAVDSQVRRAFSENGLAMLPQPLIAPEWERRCVKDHELVGMLFRPCEMRPVEVR